MSAPVKPALLLAGLAWLALEPAALANPPKRVAAFKRLPDWTGIWLSDAEHPDAGGQYVDVTPFTLAFGKPPYKAEWAERLQARRKLEMQGEAKGCDMAFPTVMQSPQPFELTVTPEETLLTAGDFAIRHIYTDGRKHPPEDELDPSRMGDSVGRWEGEVLVVDTVGQRGGPAGFGPLSYSEALHVTERIRKTGRNTLEDQIVIEDPVAFTQPWRLTLTYSRATFLKSLPAYECDRNDRIQIIDGKGRIAPP